jgi:menaquinol-cytochrome c reductase iron-sulfur subunit
MSSGEDAIASQTRRRLLASFFWAATAAVASLVATPILGYVLGPLFRRRAPSSVRVGPVAGLALDRPERVEFVVRRRDGWMTTVGRGAAWVVRRSDGIRVYDPRCTHLGCAYHWHAPTHQFMCPCHEGLFDLDGKVVGGPPPRPLDTYAARVEDGVLLITPTPGRRV